MTRISFILLMVVGMGTVVLDDADAAFAVGGTTVAGSSSAGAVAWISGGILGVAGALGIYDNFRRSSCNGDVLRLGGPGYDRPITPNDNVRPPVKCRKSH